MAAAGAAVAGADGARGILLNEVAMDMLFGNDVDDAIMGAIVRVDGGPAGSVL